MRRLPLSQPRLPRPHTGSLQPARPSARCGRGPPCLLKSLPRSRLWGARNSPGMHACARLPANISSQVEDDLRSARHLRERPGCAGRPAQRICSRSARRRSRVQPPRPACRRREPQSPPRAAGQTRKPKTRRQTAPDAGSNLPPFCFPDAVRLPAFDRLPPPKPNRVIQPPSTPPRLPPRSHPIIHCGSG